MEQHSNALKVMVIDDSKTIRRTAETLLKNVGCDVITAIDGFDALAKIVDHHPHAFYNREERVRGMERNEMRL